MHYRIVTDTSYNRHSHHSNVFYVRHSSQTHHTDIIHTKETLGVLQTCHRHVIQTCHTKETFSMYYRLITDTSYRRQSHHRNVRCTTDSSQTPLPQASDTLQKRLRSRTDLSQTRNRAVVSTPPPTQRRPAL